uniref:Secreted RxLR effector protein 94 n=1 Tax=Plasmopara viticola TaxID=143451 RepID=RLR94_PLAVT|nr:RecName: Full=Secreted RxLR effector protein 94; Flags: Precursor [Plasmopara viticola]
MAQLHRWDFWCFSTKPLGYLDVVQAIEAEVYDAWRQLRQSANPSKAWHQWKSETRKLFQDLDKKLRGQQEAVVHVAHATFTVAEMQYRQCGGEASHIVF